MDNKTFYVFTISFFVGIFVASVTTIDSVYVFILGFIIFVFSFSIKSSRKILIGTLLAFFLGFWRMDIAKANDGILDVSLGKKTEFIGIICDESQAKATSLKFCFEPEGQRDKILVTASRYPEYEYGDRLSITGKIELPENFEAYEGGPMFDYVSYLRKDGVRFIMKRAQVKNLKENHANKLISILYKIKKSFIGNIEALIPEPYSSLVAGILLGEKGLLSEDLQTAFKRTGLTHILVLSGSNVSVVAGGLMKAFASLPSTLGQSLGALSIILFAMMTGASATTIRASVMALIFILAGGVGRRYNIMRALIFAGVIMLIENPRILVFDIAFQLSFLSTLALIYVSPIVSEKLPWITERFELRGIFSATIATQIFTLPFILHVMGEISVVALIPNVLVLPIIPWAMMAGFLTGTVGFIGTVPALPFAWISDLLLAYTVYIVSFWSSLPFATIRLSLGEPVLVIVYAFYIFFIWRYQQKNSSQQSANLD